MQRQPVFARALFIGKKINIERGEKFQGCSIQNSRLFLFESIKFRIQQNICASKAEICFWNAPTYWKRKKCYLPAVSLVPTLFSKVFFFRVVKTLDSSVKSFAPVSLYIVHIEDDVKQGKFLLSLPYQAHETSVRAMVWSHNDQWMVTGDHAGFIKYWQSNMNNVKMYQGHKEAIRGIRWERVPSSGKTDHGSKVSVTSPKGSESVIIPDFFMFKIGSMVMALGVVLFDLLLAALNKCRVILFSVIMIESSSGSFLFDKKYTFLVQRGFTMNLSIFHRIGKVS